MLLPNEPLVYISTPNIWWDSFSDVDKNILLLDISILSDLSIAWFSKKNWELELPDKVSIVSVASTACAILPLNVATFTANLSRAIRVLLFKSLTPVIISLVLSCTSCAKSLLYPRPLPYDVSKNNLSFILILPLCILLLVMQNLHQVLYI